ATVMRNGTRKYTGEGSVAVVVVKAVDSAVAFGHEQIQPTVVVIIGPRATGREACVGGERVLRHLSEITPAVVMEQKGRKGSSGGAKIAAREEDIRKSVIIVITPCDSCDDRALRHQLPACD